MQEVWKDIEGYEGLYQISNLGRVKSLERNKKHSYNGIAHLKEKILKPLNINNYQRVILRKENNPKNKFIHRLVAEAFISNPNNYPYINHKDENPKNNIVSNLEWCTHKYNMNYGTINQRRSKTEKITKKDKVYCYEKNCKRVLQYDLEGNFIKEWESITKAKKTLHLFKITEVCQKKRNKCGNYIWKYKEVDELCS